jgi:hypothetical protein
MAGESWVKFLISWHESEKRIESLRKAEGRISGQLASLGNVSFSPRFWISNLGGANFGIQGWS